jgi:large subunit ribosomal protein L6
MSRVGKHEIKIPKGVSVDFQNGIATVKGTLGTISELIPDFLKVEKADEAFKFTPLNQNVHTLSMWGTIRRKMQNHVTGVSQGFTVNLELVGVGYRASVQGTNIVLQLGFSHDVVLAIPFGVTVKCEKPTAIAITGYDRQKIGQFAAEIRSYRLPEPYKGKGIIRQGEFVVRKEGKKK